MNPLTRMISRKLDTHAEIGLTRGQVALVSLEDFDRINQFVWAFHQGEHSNQRRAVRYEGRVTFFMHHDVLEVKSSQLDGEVDHINGNTLDNRRENLRIVSHEQNMQNSARHKNHVGVAFHRASNRFHAYLSFPERLGRTFSLGYWPTREKALEIVAEAKLLQSYCTSKVEFVEKWERVRPRKFARK